jgi:hypothetical protein
VASNTKASENVRIRKKRKLGRKRKNELARKGTTRSEQQMFGNKLDR